MLCSARLSAPFTGVYPVGTLVILDTQELAVVSKTNTAPEHIHEPMVKVISDSKGGPLETPVTLDISVSERTIVRTTDAQKYGIRVSYYLICTPCTPPPPPLSPIRVLMPSISERFAERRGEGRATLVPYVTAGFPSRAATVDVLTGLAEAGGDVLELGIPFSDPLADGPTIQESTFQALEGGMTVEGTLEVLSEFRCLSDAPIVLMTYLNPLLSYGFEAFLADAERAGAQGLLLTDVPTGADSGVEDAILDSALDLIRLIAPTTLPDRASAIADQGQGFLYYISRTGVTGVREALVESLGEEVSALRAVAQLPVAVGFGISTPEQAALVGGIADGVIVGSALIDALDEGGPDGGRAFLASFRYAMDQATAEA